MPRNKKPAEDGPMYRLSIRVPHKVLDAADHVVDELGVGDRSQVIRSAILHGLKVFLANPRAVRRATKITLPV